MVSLGHEETPVAAASSPRGEGKQTPGTWGRGHEGESRNNARPNSFFESFEYARERVAEEHERRLQQLEDEQPDPTFAPRGCE